MEKSSGDRNLRIGALAVVVLLILGGAARLLWPGGQESPTVATDGTKGKFRPAPAFDLKDADGRTHRLADLKGNVVVLHFWATWCPPCLDEIGNWVKFADQMKDQPKVKFVAVNLDERWTVAHKVLPSKTLPSNVISVMDVAKELPEKYGTYQYPETYLIGPDLTIVTKWVGPQPWDRPELKNIIDRVAQAR